MFDDIAIVLGFIFIIMILPTYRCIRKKRQIKRWSRALNLEAHQKVFEGLYHSVDGFAISKKAREKGDAFEYTYGEIEFLSFIALIGLTHPNRDTHFYDLGSGVGKAVLSCAMVFDMASCVGVELFEGLHHAAEKQQQQLAQLPDYDMKAKAITFIHGDFLNTPLSDATLIFINSTALMGETWQLLNEHLTQSACGATVITLSKKLTSNAYAVVRETQINMSWGVATVYIHQQKRFEFEKETGLEFASPTEQLV